jgi:hypothetical protein
MMKSRKCHGKTRRKSGRMARASASAMIGIRDPGVNAPNLSSFTSAMKDSSAGPMPQY